jgi:DNA-binding transcriptional LysR family regulator
MFGRLHVAPVVLDFLKAYPEITVRLILSDEVVGLVEGHIDAAIRIGRLSDSNMVATRMGEIRWVTCASPDYLATKGRPETPDELENHDCIMFEGVYSNNLWTFGSGEEAVVQPVRPRLAVNTADTAIAAAVSGAGITRVLSYQVALPVTDGSLEFILRRFEPDPMPVHLVHAGHTLLPLKLRAFRDFLGPRLKNRLLAIT